MSIFLSCRLDLNGVIPVPEVVSELGIVLQPSYGLIRREYVADLAGGTTPTGHWLGPTHDAPPGGIEL